MGRDAILALVILGALLALAGCGTPTRAPAPGGERDDRPAPAPAMVGAAWHGAFGCGGRCA